MIAMRVLSFLAATAALLFASSAVSAQPAHSCSALASLAVPNATVALANEVPAGAFNGPPQAFTGASLADFYKTLPAFCRVVVHAHPSADSDIVLEVWMPLTGWNGKLDGLGNGGFAGLIDYYELGAAISKGYAAVATDTGHSGSPIDAAWALNHPEKIADFGHRGIHEMTRIAKIAIENFLGSAPAHSYFLGCSDGGREALMEAQRYPADYDGILAGAPANNWTALLSSSIVDTQALTATPANFIPPAKISTIAHAVRAACDKIDGVEDGILNDPRQCHFDPASIQCKPGEDTPQCLTAPQATALKQLYTGLVDAGGHSIFPGYLPGAEDGPGGWGAWITGPAPLRSAMYAFGSGYFPNMVYSNPSWDYKSFTLQTGLADAKTKTAAALDAINPDLSAFHARGGRLILFHGWNDPAIPALSTVNYYQTVVAKLGRSTTDSFVRLYMLPGVQHCGGGPGPDSIGLSASSPSTDPEHNIRIALENWVEKGTGPGTLIATKPGANPQAPPKMTRPLCPFPQSARYKGSGDPNTAESFTCAAPAK
jgi:feruloyl esterase